MHTQVPGSSGEQQQPRMVRWRISRLRRISPQPFGLTGDPDRPPLSLGSEHSSAGMIREISAAITRAPVPLDSLTLQYGNLLDVSQPMVEVTTHWDGRGWFAPGQDGGTPAPEQIPPAWELGVFEGRDGAAARQDWQALRRPPRSMRAAGPFAEHDAEIIVGGAAREVRVVTCRDYSALSFTEGGVIVTVVSRHGLPEKPRFDPVSDLEPFCAGFARVIADLTARAGAR